MIIKLKKKRIKLGNCDVSYLEDSIIFIDINAFENLDDLEVYIEKGFEFVSKEFLENKRMRERKAKQNLNKFRKFGNNLLKLNRFAKMIKGQFNIGSNQNQNVNNKEGIDILELFRIQTEKVGTVNLPQVI